MRAWLASARANASACWRVAVVCALSIAASVSLLPEGVSPDSTSKTAKGFAAVAFTTVGNGVSQTGLAVVVSGVSFNEGATVHCAHLRLARRRHWDAVYES
jgi:hypothetical protein